MTVTKKINLMERARRVIQLESQAILSLESLLDEQFEKAIKLILETKGRVVTTGMGKAGIIAHKASATLASTGTPAVFVHPAEAVHGDLGMITPDDLVITYSNSGQTEENLRLLPYLKHFDIPTIAITSNGNSDLAKHSTVSLVLKISEEACPLNLAPTSSTTAMLVLSDTLALVTLEARGFRPEDYALLHPGGSLGRRLLTKVSDIMHTGDENPVIEHTRPLKDAIFVMTKTKLAATSVVDGSGILIGFFSDGDLRRYLMKGTPDLEAPVSVAMTRSPKHVTPSVMAVKALEILQRYKIIELPVVDESMKPIGMVHLHDIHRAGITN